MDIEQLVIGGERVPAANGQTFAVIEPATGQPFAEVAQAGVEDVKRAVQAAQRAFEDGAWPRMSATERGHILIQAAQLVRQRLEMIATVEASNAGKPIRDARGEVATVAAVLEYWGGAANKIFGETVPIQDAGLAVTLREPVGVCALIIPWNFPMLIASWKIAPALASGNTIVLKPASLTPLSALLLADILQEAGIPEGVISVLPGPGAAIGDALISHPAVSKVSFTGSTEIGTTIMQRCA
ncbi:MAG TPA: aldehyde dehydrogenase family protein, partial [Ktedonobacteraceae bacterium]|nr:aldehyde dehydrogenase family protein [Ktedonobacteraceae bacterium]